MQWLKLSVLAFAICLFIGGVQAEQDNNLCYTSHAGHCYTDVEWNVGWYWANNPPSIATCVAYHQMFTMGDFWGMCNHLNLPDNDQDGASGDGSGSMNTGSLHPVYAVTLDTSYGSGQCNLPPDGVQDDSSYDTSSCATDF